jgi:hypothetical protein
VAQSSGQVPSEQRITRRTLFVELVRAPDSYGLLLLVLVVDYVVLSVGWTGTWALIITTVFLCITPLLAFHTSRVRGPLFRAVLIAVVIALAAGIAAAVTDEDQARGVAFAIGSVLILACPIAIGSRIVKHRRVTVETLLGAICIYILIGIDFAYIDLSYQLLSGNSYFAQSGHQGAPTFAYFSFITMTTVGYGDLSPATGLPRTTAVLEALIGQIFLVVLVARLVAMYQPVPAAARRARTRARLEAEASEGAAIGDEGPGHHDHDSDDDSDEGRDNESDDE